MKIKKRSHVQHIRWMWLILVVIGFVSCKDDKDEEASPFNPGKPVVVSSFIPEEGGLGTRLVIYGDNFGNDISKVNVTIGGIKARVIGVKGQSLHCLVPPKAYDGDIKIEILNNDEDIAGEAEASTKFKYVKKYLASTFLGKRVEKVTDVVKKEGPFSDCGSFQEMRWLALDPNDNNHLYIAGTTKGCRLIDFQKEYVSNFATPNMNNVPCITFNLNGDMIVTLDQAADNVMGNFLFTRASGFKDKFDLCIARGCKNTDVHPIDGQLYFGRFRAGDFKRYDFNAPELDPPTIFSNTFQGVSFQILIHPSGNYAYIVESEKHYIMRSDYDWANKTFLKPYFVCGSAGNTGYVDGVGSSVRLNWPWQGVFVENKDYVEQGASDQYDFYFCDRANHAIRLLTPQGRVETFAGAAPTNDGKGVAGYNDGDLRTQARFSSPESITYDKVRKCFYIGDNGNYVVRKIAFEE